MKKSKGLKRYLSIIMAFCLVMAMSAAAFAAEGTTNTAVRDDRTGVVQVNVVYTTDDGDRVVIQTGSGFMINELNVVTCNHVTQLNDETMELACNAFGVDSKKLREKLSIRISVMRDVSVKATVTTNSAQMDFAVLKLDEKLAGCKNLPLRASKDLEQTEDCFALGFPTIPTLSQDGVKYTSEDVTITYGKVNKVSTIGGVEYVVHSAKVSGGNSGGPLVDAAGNVVGIIQGNLTDGMSEAYSYAIASDALIETLDRLAVTYVKPGEPAPQTDNGGGEQTGGEEPAPAPEPAEQAPDKTALESAISQAEGKDLSGYTDESAKAVQDALTTAKQVDADANATQATVDDATTALSKATTGLVEKKGPAIPIWLIAVIAAAVIAIIAVIIMMTRNNKPAPRRTGGIPQTPPQVPPVPPVQPMGNIPPAYQGGAGTSVLGGGSNETTVLSGGNETTVLSADYGTLTRISTGEKITINKERFAIGRERGRVDYCISDNTAVGRSHAVIVNRGGNAYVIDQNSRNCTYVNDQRAGANQEVKIKSGDKITFADEAFTYNAR